MSFDPRKSKAIKAQSVSFLIISIFTLFTLTLSQCQSPPALTRQQEVDRLLPDNRIFQAERFYREKDVQWALYAWNRTRLKDLTSTEARESYRLLKTWLFSREMESSNAQLSEMQVSAMYLDYDDLWLGTWNGGLYRLSLSSSESFVLEADTPSLVPKVVYRIRKSGNAFWFAMHQGLRYYNFNTGVSGWLNMPGITGAVGDFLENSEGLFVASLTQGAWRRTAAGDVYPLGDKTMKPSVVALEYQDDVGLILGTAEEGAFRWKNEVVEPLQNVEPIFRRLKHVSQVVNDGESLWFASIGEGLFRWQFKAAKAYQITLETFLLRTDRIRALLHSGDWIFIGDEKGGIAAYHLKDQRWYIWDSGRNLEFGNISALAYRNGELFYSTLSGGVYQIHWLKYLFALREKNDNF